MLCFIVPGDHVFEHECKNQLNGEQSKSNVRMPRHQGRFRFCFFNNRRWKNVSKSNQSFASRMKHSTGTQKHSFFRENFALRTHYVKNFLEWRIGIVRSECDVSTITSVPPPELAPNDPLHRHMIMFRCCASLSTVMFLSHSYRGAKSHDCNKAKEHQMQWNLLYVSKTPLAWPELLFFLAFRQSL